MTPDKLPKDEFGRPNAILVTGLIELIPLRDELVELFTKETENLLLYSYIQNSFETQEFPIV